MKLTTLALLTLTSMTATSAGVWMLVPPPTASANGPIPVGTPSTAADSSDGSLADVLGLGAKVDFTAGTTVKMNGRLGHAVLEAGRASETFLYVDLEAELDAKAKAQAPVDLAIVIDRSGSMQGRRMENAIAAASGMIRRLRDGDTVSIVAYDTTTEIVAPTTTISPRTRDEVSFSLRGLRARGNTCVSCGLEAAMELLGSRQGAVKKILLLSDGEANAGVRDEEGFRRLASRARDMDCSISSIGVDVDYNERIMFAVAQESNGRHYFVENASGLPRIFDEELQSLVSTVASNVEVEIDLADGVEVVEILDRSFRRQGDKVVVPFGALAAGDRRTLLARLRLSRSQPGLRPIADVALRYTDLVAGEPGECQGELVARATVDRSEVSDLDPLVEARLARAETVRAIARANEEFESGNVSAAQSILEESRTRIRKRHSGAATKSGLVGRAKAKFEADFERQFDAFESAESGFGQAQQASPAAPATSREGKASIRRNADAFDDLSL